MSRSITLFIIGLLFTSMAFATPVDKKTAKEVAISFYKTNAPDNFTDFSVKETFKDSYKGETSYYIFAFKSGGFVMVAADDAVKPILGYSFKGEFRKSIDNPVAESWFEEYKLRIDNIRTNASDNNETKAEWNNLLNGSSTKNEKTVDPLVETTWGQGNSYNDYCPSNVPVGCVATTMAQIMNYHEYPANGVGWHMFSHSTYGTQIAYFSDGNYDYSSMPNSGGNDDVAWLMYHCGVAVDMNYAPGGSGAQSVDVTYAMANYFKFDQSINYISKANYTDAEWKATLKVDLDNGLPVYYSGSGDAGGHAFVCDGYNSNDYFHFNWGWDGYLDGYFAIGSLNPGGDSFNADNGVVVII